MGMCQNWTAPKQNNKNIRYLLWNKEYHGVSILNQIIEISRTKNILCNKQLSTIRLQRAAQRPGVPGHLGPSSSPNTESSIQDAMRMSARATGYHSIWKSRIGQPHRPEKSVFFSRVIPWRIRNSCLQGPILCKQTPEAAWFLEQISNSPQNYPKLLANYDKNLSSWGNEWSNLPMNSQFSVGCFNILSEILARQVARFSSKPSKPCHPYPWHPGKYPLCIRQCILVQPEFPSGISWNWFRSSFNLVQSRRFGLSGQNPGRVTGNLAEGRAMHLLLNQNWRSLSEKSKVAKSEPSIIYVHNVQTISTNFNLSISCIVETPDCELIGEDISKAAMHCTSSHRLTQWSRIETSYDDPSQLVSCKEPFNKYYFWGFFGHIGAHSAQNVNMCQLFPKHYPNFQEWLPMFQHLLVTASGRPADRAGKNRPMQPRLKRPHILPTSSGPAGLLQSCQLLKTFRKVCQLISVEIKPSRVSCARWLGNSWGFNPGCHKPSINLKTPWLGILLLIPAT